MPYINTVNYAEKHLLERVLVAWVKVTDFRKPLVVRERQRGCAEILYLCAENVNKIFYFQIFVFVTS